MVPFLIFHFPHVFNFLGRGQKSTKTMNISKFALLLSAFFLSTTRMDPSTSTSTETSSSSSFSSSIVVHALSQSIVVVGLNAALQRRFVLPPGADLEPGNVHRASKCDTGVGGKGQDVGVALSCLMNYMTTKKEVGVGLHDIDVGIDAASGAYDSRRGRVILAQFLGMGAEGDAVSIALTSKYGLRDESLTVRNAAPLRTCTTIVGANCATELVETSGEVTSDEMSALFDGIDELTSEAGKGGRGRGGADCVCVMGSMPPGCPEDTYADMVRRLADSGSLVLVDSVIGLGPLLKTLKSIFENDDDDDDDDYGGDDSSNAAKRDGGGGAVLKLNAAELCKLGGVVRTSGESCRVTHDELSSSAKGFVSRYADAVGALEYLCVTDGKVSLAGGGRSVPSRAEKKYNTRVRSYRFRRPTHDMKLSR